MEEGFEVEGAHEHEVHHQAHSGDSLGQSVAIFTAIVAALGAFVSYLGGHTQNEALYYKNEAVLLKAQASDQWSFYQAKSTKAHMMEVAAALAGPGRDSAFIKDRDRFEEEKKVIKQKALDLDKKSEEADAESQHALHPHNQLAQAMTLIQVSIALASITALTRKRWLFALAAVFMAGGSILAGIAMSSV